MEEKKKRGRPKKYESVVAPPIDTSDVGFEEVKPDNLPQHNRLCVLKKYNAQVVVGTLLGNKTTGEAYFRTLSDVGSILNRPVKTGHVTFWKYI